MADHPGEVQAASNPFGIAPWKWEKIQALRLLDNLLMHTAMNGFKPGVQFILRIILNMPDLVISDLHVEALLPSLTSREVILDVKAADLAGKRYNIEVQCRNSGAIPQRPRYHSALMDVEFLQKGQNVAELPETYIVFITEHDVLGAGLPVYHINRVVEETGLPFGDGTHIVYANASYVGDDAIGRLMSDFRASNPDDMHYPLLAEQVRAVKSMRKGGIELSSVLDELYKEARNEGIEEGIEKGIEKARIETLSNLMRRNRWTLDQALDITGYPMDQKPRYEQLLAALTAR